jgi:hypothetical protein
MTADASQQRPRAGGSVVDHVAHCIADMGAAETALARLGFTLTPLSHQLHRTDPGGPLVSAGTANRCAMLAEGGYLEFLATTGDTPNAAKLRAAMARYRGVHLVCFGTIESDAVHARLTALGFAPPPVVALQREIGTADGGTATVRFAVTRAAPEAMPEGRVQFCEHHTPDLMWQPRWLDHPNGATRLAGVAIAVVDLDEAATRWQRFSAQPARPAGSLRVIATDRGEVILGTRAAIAEHFGAEAPVLPWIAGPILGVRDLAASTGFLAAAGLRELKRCAGRVVVEAPAALGGVFAFQRAADAAG